MRVHTIGSLARQQLTRAQTGRVIGRSSHGLYLRLDSAWVIFLAWDGSPGPLSLNLASGSSLDLPQATAVQLTAAGLGFPPPMGLLDLSAARVWQAPAPESSPAGLLPQPERAARLADTTRLALAIRPGAGWSALLPGAEAGPDGPANLPPAIPPALQVTRAALARADSFSAADALGYLLGLGSGLTPSGDDLALGLLLAVSRWGEVLVPRLNRDDFTTRVVQCARQATTDLSASLIEAAALGQADQRLIAALDSLLTGQPGVAECAAGLAEWGNSSGLDALLGMSMVI